MRIGELHTDELGLDISDCVGALDLEHDKFILAVLRILLFKNGQNAIVRRQQK